MKIRAFPISKASIGFLVCTLAFTALVRGNAGSERVDEGSAVAEIARLENSFTSEEMEFMESIGGENANFDQLAEVLGAPTPKFFTYTKENGLDARANPFCERFLDRQGQYGIYGKVISDYLNAKYKSNQTTPMLADDLVGMVKSPNICPNWRNLTINGRIRFWVWTFAAIASVEATCGANPRAISGVAGMHGKTAIGLLQLEKAKKDRAWRNIPSCNVSSTEIASTYWNLRCGMDIMEGLIDGSGRKNPWPIYPVLRADATSYWQELRRAEGGKIGKLMRNFTPCFERSSAWPK